MFKWLALFVVVAYANADSSEHGVEQGSSGTSCKCGWANKNEKRIIGGTFYKENEFPFIAGLAMIDFFDRKPQYLCGGSIITPNHVLTAAHCTAGFGSWTDDVAVVLGTHDRAQRGIYDATIGVRKIDQHPDYSKETLVYDIALLTLRKSINFNSRIGPVCMPQPGLDITGQTVTILGWGAEYHKGPMTKTPKKAIANVVTPAKCANEWVGMASISTTKPLHVCTYSKSGNSCQGDSGGPVVWLDPQTNRYTLVGVVSFGPACSLSDERPTVHTRVEALLPWIQERIAATEPSATCTKV